MSCTRVTPSAPAPFASTSSVGVASASSSEAPAYAHVNASELAAPFEEPTASAFVYLDVYPGNVLVHAGRVSAVLDFGGGVLIGDPRFNALAAASYLRSEDRPTGEAWLAERGLAATRAFRRWLAAYWAFGSRRREARFLVPLRARGGRETAS